MYLVKAARGKVLLHARDGMVGTGCVGPGRWLGGPIVRMLLLGLQRVRKFLHLDSRIFYVVFMYGGEFRVGLWRRCFRFGRSGWMRVRT
jgi:hypothetical protein